TRRCRHGMFARASGSGSSSRSPRHSSGSRTCLHDIIVRGIPGRGFFGKDQVIKEHVMLRGKRLGLGVLGAALLLSLVAPHCTGQQPSGTTGVNAGNAPAGIDSERRKLEKIRPGTVIGAKAPDGWTDLVHFAGAALTEEDLQAAPKTAAFYAQLFRYALL